MSNKTTIKVSTNYYLWLLSGRSSDFYNRALNTGVDYHISRTPEVVKRAREVLRLDYLGHDFYVINAMASVYGVPELLGGLTSEVSTLFAPGALRIPDTTSSVTMLAPTGTSHPYVDGSKAGSGGFFKVTIRYQDSDEVIVSLDNGREYSLGYSLIQDGDNYRLVISELDKETGVFAQFQVEQWQSGDEIGLQVAPTNYPFDAVVESINNDPEFLRLMAVDAALLEVFSSSDDAFVKLGAFCVAIMLRMKESLTGDALHIETTVSVGGDLQRDVTVKPIWVDV